MSGAAAKRSDVLAALEAIAPLQLAEDWDNVGLLVDVPDAADTVRHAVLTIDLSEAVLDGAIRAGAELIVAYHPPIFGKLTRLTAAAVKERIILRAIRAGISIYSPHTALDAAPGGVNDWLCDAFGPGQRVGIPPRGDDHPGLGRRIELDAELPLDACVAKIKTHLGLGQVRLAARSSGAPVRSVAVCAGAGGSVLTGQPADLWLTGEMRHHDVVAAIDHDTSVVLCDHTNTERGYLPRLRSALQERCPDLQVSIADCDADPLVIV